MIINMIKRLIMTFVIFTSLVIVFSCENKNDIAGTKKYYDKSSIVKYSGFDDSAKLEFEELRALAGQAKELENIKRMEKDLPPDNFNFDLDRYYTGIVKDVHDRISYYEYGELIRSGVYQVKGYSGLEDLKYVLIDNRGYLKKNYFLQDHIIKGSAGVSRSYYAGEDYNVVKDVDIQFNSDTLSNKRILNRDDIHHFGKNMYLTKRIQTSDSGKEENIEIKGKWQKDEGGEWQYLNPNGYIAKNSMISYTKNKKKYMYYVDKDGHIVKNYFLQGFNTGNGIHDYYFDDDGAMGIGDGIKTYVIVDRNTPSNKDVDGEYTLRIGGYGHVVEKIGPR